MKKKIQLILTALTLLAVAYRADAVKAFSHAQPSMVADEGSNELPVWPPIWWPVAL